VTKDGADILHRIRGMGNQAAHEQKAHTEAQLVAAFEVVEHMLKGVSIIPSHASSLPETSTARLTSTNQPGNTDPARHNGGPEEAKTSSDYPLD
jgi:hypothetical protein